MNQNTLNTLNEACQFGSLHKIKELLRSMTGRSFPSNRAIRESDIEYDPFFCEAFSTAVGYGRLHVVKYFVGLVPRDCCIDACFMDSITLAAKHGRYNVFEYMMNSKRWDPSDLYCTLGRCYFSAAKNGHLQIVKLMASTGVLELEQHRDAFFLAIGHDHLEIVMFLASLPSVDPGAYDNRPIRNAVRKGHLEIVKFLASLPSVNPGAKDCQAIINAAGKGYLDVVKFLASLPSVYPGARDNLAIRAAADYDHLDVVKFLASLPSPSLGDIMNSNACAMY